MGYEAPVHIAWSQYNRSPLIRIPAISEDESTRIELRSPDPSCNPYLTIALILAAGLDGIEKGLTPSLPVDCNVYDMEHETRSFHKIESLPTNLKEALVEMEKDPLIKNTLGEHTFRKYLQLQYKEWNEYQSQIHDWEIQKYLTRY
jgi:glutamine synthetase